MNDIVGQIRTCHRQQRFMIKMQSRIDRSMEAYIRVNVFGFSPDLEEAKREEISKKTTALVKLCRADQEKIKCSACGTFHLIPAEESKVPEELAFIAKMVRGSDQSRAHWDELLADRERLSEKLAKQLPAADFVKNAPGVGLLGFAQIIGEAGDLSNYPTVAKLWKRLGLHTYDGFAMSTWMRETWRPRKLTSDEWIDNPFKPERYAIMAQIAQWLWVKQWTGKKKAPPDGEPNGPYGELYARRRAHTAFTHDDWTPMHSHKDALRYMFKKFIRDLWREWRRESGIALPLQEAAE